jgi:hypothetical protein
VSVSSQEIEVKFTIAIPEIDEAQRLEAERKAREAFIMELLRQGNISAGRAAELLASIAGSCPISWDFIESRPLHPKLQKN